MGPGPDQSLGPGPGCRLGRYSYSARIICAVCPIKCTCILLFLPIFLKKSPKLKPIFSLIVVKINNVAHHLKVTQSLAAVLPLMGPCQHGLYFALFVRVLLPRC